MKLVPAVRARPKSRIFRVQSLFTTMLDGFRSYNSDQLCYLSIPINVGRLQVLQQWPTVLPIYTYQCWTASGPTTVTYLYSTHHMIHVSANTLDCHPLRGHSMCRSISLSHATTTTSWQPVDPNYFIPLSVHNSITADGHRWCRHISSCIWLHLSSTHSKHIHNHPQLQSCL